MARKLKELYFTIDLRSLGLFRILLALMLINDWGARWPDLDAFYTSRGVLPVDAPLPKSGGQFHFSLLDGVTSLPMVQLVFCFGLLCYVMFLIGQRTKFFHILSFIFFVSVLNRNLLLRDGGDVVMLTMLMWSLFLPLGERFSFDAIRTALCEGVDVCRHRAAPRPDRSQSSLAAFVIVAQIGLIYFFTACAKCGPTWKDGTAIYYALNFDQMVRPLGQWLAGQPLWWLKAMTWATLTIEFAALPLILLPVGQPWLRRAAIVGLSAMHLGIAATMTIGAFSFVMIATYALLLLPEDWTALDRMARRCSRPVTVYYDDTCGFCHRCAQWLVLADRPGNVTFIGSTEEARFKHQLTRAELDASIVVFDDASQAKTTQSRAVAAIFRALPLPFHVFRIVGLPGIRVLSDTVYDLVARNRHRISQWFGYAACGMERVPDGAEPAVTSELSPFVRLKRAVGRVTGNVVVAVVFVSVLVDSYNLNVTPRLKSEKVHEPRWMRAIIMVPLIEHDWSLFAPDPAKDDGWWVVDGETESGNRLDPLTGHPPTFDKPGSIASRLDRYWRKYLYRIWLKKYTEYRLYFGKYLTLKNHREKPEGQRLVRFYIYYVQELTRPPGSPKPFLTERLMLWHHECFDEATGKPEKS